MLGSLFVSRPTSTSSCMGRPRRSSWYLGRLGLTVCTRPALGLVLRTCMPRAHPRGGAVVYGRAPSPIAAGPGHADGRHGRLFVAWLPLWLPVGRLPACFLSGPARARPPVWCVNGYSYVCVIVFSQKYGACLCVVCDLVSCSIDRCWVDH